MKAIALVVFLSVFGQSFDDEDPVKLSLAMDGQKALEIATKAYLVDNGWGGHSTSVKMRITNHKGRARERSFIAKALEIAGDGDMLLTIFSEPRDISGAFFLTHAHIGREDDMWMFLPAAGRLRKIVGAMQGQSYFGSHLSYENVTSHKFDEYGYTLFKPSDLQNDFLCSVINRTPKYADSGYSSQNVWIDQDEHLTHRIDCYERDRNGKEERTKKIELFEYKSYITPNGNFWRAGYILVTEYEDDKPTGAKTEIWQTNHQFPTNLIQRDFDPDRLK